MIDGMATYLSTTLENIGKMNPVEADKINLAPHIALYCAWGMHEDIASTLASSIKFPNINDLIVEIDVQKDHLPKSLTGKKRKNDVNIDSTMIPHVPAKVALKSLDDILCGDDQCFAFARTSILSSSTACSCIQKSLETGTKFASKILSQEYVSSHQILCYLAIFIAPLYLFTYCVADLFSLWTNFIQAD